MLFSRNAFATHVASSWASNGGFPGAVGEIERRTKRTEFSTLGLPPSKQRNALSQTALDSSTLVISGRLLHPLSYGGVHDRLQKSLRVGR